MIVATNNVFVVDVAANIAVVVVVLVVKTDETLVV